MTRRSVAVVIRHVRETTDAGTQTTFYGPFLPHAGSAVTSMLWRLDDEAYGSDRVTSHQAFIEDVFIGEGESDAEVVSR